MYQGLAETIANDCASLLLTSVPAVRFEGLHPECPFFYTFAVRLNLSYDPKPWDEDLPTDWEAILEDRAQVFATLTCVGSMWGAYVGRESVLPSNQFSQSPLPLTPDLSSAPLVDRAFAYHARLASISIPAIEQIYNRVYPSVDLHIQVCLSFLDALDRWCVSHLLRRDV